VRAVKIEQQGVSQLLPTERATESHWAES
jgi:hypothetical protein